MRRLSGAFSVAVVATALTFSGCGKKEEPVSAQPGGTPAAGTQPAAGGAAPAGANGVAATTPGAAPAASQPVAPPPPPPPPPPREFTVVAGTPIQVVTSAALSTKTAQTGQPFEGNLAAPLVVDGYVIAPKGAPVGGVVALSDPGGKVKGVASIALTLKSIQGKGGRLTVATSQFSQSAKSTKKKDAAKIGIGAGVGAAIGAIAGGGKGAAIGAGIGGAGGTGLVLATKGDPAVIPAEAVVTFKLSAPVTVTEIK